MNDEFERMWKETSMKLFEVLSRQEGAEENRKNP
jgi:hypothetical protein